MRIELETLERATTRLFEYLRETGRTSLEIGEDYYWHIPTDTRYDPFRKPEELTIGQLSDDWREISRIAQDEAEPVGFALCWLAALLERYGEQSGW